MLETIDAIKGNWGYRSGGWSGGGPPKSSSNIDFRSLFWVLLLALVYSSLSHSQIGEMIIEHLWHLITGLFN
ncbi:MAG: hypothetical protein R2932_20455 [Caldilineaceae bacterium]